jgi:alpha-beta hydrolase superfamily lysophospholipase
MEAKDGSFGFDFWGIYDEVEHHEKLISTLGDGRKLEVKFLSLHKVTEIMQTFEAEEVKTCVDYLTKKGEKNIFLFGTSMGAVAIMKAMHDFDLKPTKIIIECPFGSMYKTVCARFKIMNAPTFPMAGLLVFWGGVQNGFWAFGHNPTAYAKKISCPTLVLYGQRDNKVSKAEIDEIFTNLAGQKYLRIYPNAGHENYLIKYKEAWTKDVSLFMKTER